MSCDVAIPGEWELYIDIYKEFVHKSLANVKMM